MKNVNQFFYININILSSYLEWHSQKIAWVFSIYSFNSKYMFAHNEIGIWPLIFTLYFYHHDTPAAFLYQINLQC